MAKRYTATDGEHLATKLVAMPAAERARELGSIKNISARLYELTKASLRTLRDSARQPSRRKS